MQAKPGTTAKVEFKTCSLPGELGSSHMVLSLETLYALYKKGLHPIG